MFDRIKKRNGEIVKFEAEKITNAIYKAGQATGEFGMDIARKLTLRVLDLAIDIIGDRTPSVEEIQDIVEDVLITSPYKKTAKAYIIYREQHAKLREITTKANLDLVNQYLTKADWRVNENSNMSFSLQGLNNYVSSEVTKTYWLNSIYPPEVRAAYINGDIHIHDLGCLSVYCVGWDLQDLLTVGFKGAVGKVESKPAKHFRTALGQIVNFFYTLQGEAAGAQAFSNFDTLLSPFIKYDGLGYKEVKQALQEFIFNVNVPTRVGFQSPFTNLTLDLTVPSIYKDQPVVVGGELKQETYKEFQREMDMLNRAFLEVMLEGDAKGRVFTFPIPTYNITKDFNWDNENTELLWQVTAKYGIPYFSNFINSDMHPEDVRSMCCRLRLQTDELRKRGGGLFGANPLTGCYDEETEVLTISGWKRFYDVTLDDELFTRREDGKVEIHKPIRKFEYNWDGYLIRFKHKSLDLLVTPNHKMVIERYGKYKLVEAQDFDPNNDRIPKYSYWEGYEEEYFTLPPVSIFKGIGPRSKFSKEKIEKIRQLKTEGKSIYEIAPEFACNPVTVYNILTKENYGAENRSKVIKETEHIKIKMDDWLAFFGIWLAEGSVDNENIVMDHGYRVTITQTKEDVRKEIQDLLDRLPFNYSMEGPRFVIYSKQLWNYLKQFGNTYDRFIPDEIKKLSKRQLKILFDWMVKGDGHIRESTGQINYWTASKRLADDFQEIVMKLGWLATVTPRIRKILSTIDGREIHSFLTYTIGIQKSKHYRLRKTNISREYYKGKVYCVEIPNHTLFVRRNGKVTWSGNSVGVVTINMPRIGYLANSEEDFFNRLEDLMIIAKTSLEIKRKIIEKLTDEGLYPYSAFYLRNVKERFGKYWTNHFSTIGIVGMNEACLNLFGKNIGTQEGREFTIKVMKFMREKLIEFQEETGNYYNLEATPAEGTSYRLARIDKTKYPDIICANEEEYRKGAEPFYTNSSHLPVNYTDDVFETLELQDEVQCLYTGGTVIHLFTGERIDSPEGVKKLVRVICERFKLPYFTITPTFSVCPEHGYIKGEVYHCDKCGRETEVYSRIVGYLRPVSQWNKGKAAEFKIRKTYILK